MCDNKFIKAQSQMVYRLQSFSFCCQANRDTLTDDIKKESLVNNNTGFSDFLLSFWNKFPDNTGKI